LFLFLRDGRMASSPDVGSIHRGSFATFKIRTVRVDF